MSFELIAAQTSVQEKLGESSIQTSVNDYISDTIPTVIGWGQAQDSLRPNFVMYLSRPGAPWFSSRLNPVPAAFRQWGECTRENSSMRANKPLERPTRLVVVLSVCAPIGTERHDRISHNRRI